MQTGLIVAPPIDLPDTPHGIYEAAKSIDIGIETANTVAYWLVGECIRKLVDDLAVKHPVEAMARETRFDKRTLHYCQRVRRVFEYELLITLTQKGLTWSATRELASENISDEDRQSLLEQFSNGDITPLELYERAVALRKGLASSDGPESADTGNDGDDESDQGRGQDALDKLFNETVNALSLKGAELNEKVAQAYLDFRHDLADALLDDNAETDPDKAQQLDDTTQTLAALAVNIVKLAGAVMPQTGNLTWPFADLDVELENLRNEFAIDEIPEAPQIEV